MFMKSVNKTILQLLLLFPVFSFCQEKGEELIEWNSSKKLSWSDYKGKADAGSAAAASTATYLNIEYNFDRNGLSYKITCSFSKNKSWTRDTSDYILAHEQGHFDIAEIFARKLNKKMQEYQVNTRTMQNDLKKIYQEVMDEKAKMQSDYDKETNHSIIKEKQMEWLKKIEQLLEEYKNYAAY
jgi:hypothetical protein